MVTEIFRTALVVVLVTVFQVTVSAATISVRTDINPVPIDESFQLIFEADGKVDGEPDFSPLNQYFQILSTSQSSNFSIVNGQVTSSRRWNLSVIAKVLGNLKIPPISFGQDTSSPAEIEITNHSGGSADNQRGANDIFLEASVTESKPYVQSQVVYTVKLFRSVPIARASLTDPEITEGNALIERADDDKSYERNINGKNYYVIERNFAIYPQSSGKISVSPVTFMGQVARNPYSFDPLTRQPRTIVRRTEEISLDVRQIPGEFAYDHWLPAENVTIAEEWSVNPLNLRAGEPVTRTLILNADALTASQLPELSDTEIDDFKFYPERPELTNNRISAGIAGTRKQKAAIIPDQPGNYTLPEISIPWWNTVTDKLEYAVLPARTIRVQAAAGNAGSNDTGSAPSLQEELDSIQVTTETDTASTPIQAQDPGAVTTADIWKLISLILLLVWLYSLYRNRQSTNSDDKSDGHQGRKNTVKGVLKALAESCRQGDPHEARKNVLLWAGIVWPESPPATLGGLAGRTGPQLSAELQKLNSAVYSKDSGNWDGETFLEIFRNEPLPDLKNTRRQPHAEGKLEPLYRI